MTTTFIPHPTPSRSHPPLFTAADFGRAAAFYDQRPELPPTPLVDLPALARTLQLGEIVIKDESGRFGLNAFKLLGARFAIEELLADGTIQPGATLVCASEGNHGRAVAHTAGRVGCQARVYLSESVAPARAAAIENEGATVVRVAGTYDDAVRAAAADAAAHGWEVISDTSWDGYDRIPWLIMLGYSRMMDEVARARPEWRPDVIVVPGGVGGLLAAVATWTAHHWLSDTRIVAVEPASAACLQVSARHGRPTSVPGPFDTMMGGLRCGEVSPAAFAGAAPYVAAYVAIDDEWAARAMRLFARPVDSDPRVESGASGASTLGALLAVLEDPAAAGVRTALDLGPSTRVLLINSEGITDPPLWRSVVGGTA